MRRSVIVSLFVSLLTLSAYGQLNMGQTYDTYIPDAVAPHLRATSKDTVNGEPLYDAFFLVKAKFNGIYNIEGGLQDQETFNLSQIDVWDDDDTPNLAMDLHQTQVRFRAQKQTSKGTFIGYLEGDFWAGDNVYRLRHAWFDFKFMHIGQDWSTFGDKDIWPNVFDWDGPSSGVWIRHAMIRLYHQFEKRKWEVEFSIEQPNLQLQSDIELATPYESTYQSVPDLIGTVKKYGDFGHFRLAGIYRNLRYELFEETVILDGYGLALSGLVRTHANRKNMFQFQAVAGQGISSYLVSFGGSDFNAVPNTDGELETVPVTGGWASYEHWLNDEWHANIVLGATIFMSPEINSYTIPTPGWEATNSSVRADFYYGLINFMYDPIPDLTLGLEYNVGNKEVLHEGALDNGLETVEKVEANRIAQRISFGAFFNF